MECDVLWRSIFVKCDATSVCDVLSLWNAMSCVVKHQSATCYLYGMRCTMWLNIRSKVALTQRSVRGIGITYHSVRGTGITYKTVRGTDITYHTVKGIDVTYHTVRGTDIRYHTVRGRDITRHKVRGRDGTLHIMLASVPDPHEAFAGRKYIP